ncbi:ATP-binding protein [Yinghuangia sp. YIM S09857]|uniref:ATP-binding protein n=1 Tax=Yinghuangia sp. YIM S09857 TaxID=3436929 RepID=UPI003F52CE53
MDSSAGPVEHFARRLRDLRDSVGLTYAQMAKATGRSASTLSQAANGQRLPTLAATLAYVQACGADTGLWERDWHAVSRAVRASGRGMEAPERPIVRPSPVPDEPTSFVGRTRDLEVVDQLLRSARLVTLTGVGGVGKTRLAAHIAHHVADRYPDGIYFIQLADLGDPVLLTKTVAGALRIAEDPAQDTMAALTAELANATALIILDNCEHLHGSCAALVRSVLSSAPGLSVLATSRQQLGIAGEHVVPVGPLTFPSVPEWPVDGGLVDRALDDGDLVDGGLVPGGSADPSRVDTPPADDVLRRYTAMRLFCDRAAAVLPGFRLADDDHATLAAICRRLDGLPLAIELAARWLRVLTLPQLLERLEGTFALPLGADPTAHARHRTLNAVLDWSHALCSPGEQDAWARLALVAGSMPLDLAEVLVGDSPDAGAPLAVISGLVDKSLLGARPEGSAMRYRMPETVRTYGTARLRPEHSSAARLRHIAWCTRLAVAAEAEWYGPGQTGAFARVRREHHHIQAALGDESGATSVDRLRIAGDLWLYWIACGRLSEGRDWLEHLLATDTTTTTPERARAQWAAAFVALVQGDLEAATAHNESAGSAAEELGLPVIQGRVRMLRGLLHLFASRLAEAVEESNRAREACEAADDGIGAQLSVAQRSLTQAFQGDLAAAQAGYATAIAMSENAGEEWHLSYTRWCLGLLHLGDGRPDAALPLLRESLLAKHRFHDRVGAAAVTESLAWALADLGHPEDGAALLGAAGALRPSGAAGLFGMRHLVADAHRRTELLRARIGAPRFDELVAATMASGPDAAMNLALQRAAGTHTKCPPTDPR